MDEVEEEEEELQMKSSAGWCGGWCGVRAEAARPVVSDRRCPHSPPGAGRRSSRRDLCRPFLLFPLPAFVSADTEGSGRRGVCGVWCVCSCVCVCVSV